jgi:hypothetical protein
VNINRSALISKFERRTDDAQRFLDNEVLRQSRPFVPFLQGTLANTALVEEPGKIVYVQPYARRLYYGVGFNFTKQHHPRAGAKWTDRAKASFLNDWKRGVEKILKGGNA